MFATILSEEGPRIREVFSDKKNGRLQSLIDFEVIDARCLLCLFKKKNELRQRVTLLYRLCVYGRIHFESFIRAWRLDRFRRNLDASITH